MNTEISSAVPWWSRRPHFLLAGHLLLLHALAFGGWRLPAVRILWFVAFGLFLLWQPFVAGERRMSRRQGAVVLAAALASTWLLSPWLMLIWCGALAAVIGGRVLWTGDRLERAGYLFAFGYLVCLTIFGVVPEISPSAVLDPLPRDAIARYMPFLLAALIAFPAHPQRRRAGDAFDLFYGMLVFLALAVFVLGALAVTFVSGVSYVEALAQTSLAIAAALLVLAWAWNPRGGFSGIGSALSRYLLSVGLPLEQWLIQLAETSERESHPVRFLAAITEQLQRIPWVVGCRWQAGSESGRFGGTSPHTQEYRRDGVLLAVCFRHVPSPAMRWHVEWLLRLATEFYLVKFQTHELQRMSYLQAVYETGARVTHDVKNLLQSLQTLCYAAAQPGDPEAVARLLARQLPQIAERLKSTLDKLQRPRADDNRNTSAAEWWARLRDRHSGDAIEWNAPAGEAEVPSALFDSIAENLLQNALTKRQHEGGIEISAKLTVDRNSPMLTVRDTGQAIAASVADSLFRTPVQSAHGLGIGLYHAARQADETGYRLNLAENRPGSVVFTLAPRT
ncbi:MAG: hypothetical protein J0M01_16180 [Dechloromonas sp.]|nr:hypothetical protein [Dechloromonas sp.]